ncbi:phage baseplate assembly protein V [uncultured Megasphaera sp.]|uniref:phage baseplate assembly protein V n=1 Tax=uncultured Megasphaera sp. TaxID=165188 RepID=UPI00266C6B93|nr:phage baseplate assembly protein V [uncultured Megasphaera sp.]
MGTDNQRLFSALRRIIRIGNVSSVNPEKMTCRVVFRDMDDAVSDELPLLNTGSAYCRDYWLPVVNEQVVCLMFPNSGGTGNSAGIVLGSFFNEVDEPIKTGTGIRRIDFGDGSYMEHDSNTGNMTVQATGTITIKGATVKINE